MHDAYMMCNDLHIWCVKQEYTKLGPRELQEQHKLDVRRKVAYINQKGRRNPEL